MPKRPARSRRQCRSPRERVGAKRRALTSASTGLAFLFDGRHGVPIGANIEPVAVLAEHPSKGVQAVTIRCGSCHKPLESSETIHVAEEGPRCYPCFNRETADRLGIDFEEPQFQPI